MKQLLLRLIVYPTAGIGIYHAFFGNGSFYGFVILIIGLLGILCDMFYKKVGTE